MNETQFAAEEKEVHWVIQDNHSAVAPLEVTWSTEPSGELIETCESWRAFTGQTIDQIKGFGWLDAIHPDDRDRVHESWVNTVAKGSVYVSEFRLRRADGAMRYMSVRGVPGIKDRQIVKLTGFCGDITDAINYLHLILRERDFSNAVIECLPGIFYVTDEDGNLIRWNRAAELISGYSAEELAHKHGYDLVHSPHKQKLHDTRKKVFDTGSYEELEAEFVTKSGKHIPFFVNGHRVFFHGKPCMMGVGLDISQRKNAERELLELNAALEQRVQERTKELEDSYKELEAFSYTVSHDLRAPLQAIRGFAQILKEDYSKQLDREGRDVLERIIQADERMTRLTNDILSYSLLGNAAVKLETVPLAQLIRYVHAEFELRLKEIGGQLQADLDQHHVQGDLTLLAQIFANLFQNSINYRRDDAPLLLKVSSRQESDDIVISVSDNGQGIDPKHHGKVFQPFQRLHSNAQVPGTGLGLATVKKSVERIGGKIWLESKAGEGTTFFIRLKSASVHEPDKKRDTEDDAIDAKAVERVRLDKPQQPFHHEERNNG